MTLLDDIVARLGAMPAATRADIERQVMDATKEKKFIPSPGPQTQAWFCKADVLLYGGEAGGGKRLCDNTLVPVPLTTDASGYKRHGDLAAGDEVYSPRGCAVRVLGVHGVTSSADAYAVEFSTGEVIVADGDHLWHTWTLVERLRKLRSSVEWRAKRRGERASRAVEHSKKPWVSKSITAVNRARVHDVCLPTGGIRTTHQIAATLLLDDGDVNHSIDATLPLDGSVVSLPIDPYLLGLWLGDGHTNNGQIGMMVDDWQCIAALCPPVKSEALDCRPPRMRAYSTRRFEGLQSSLRRLGVIGLKHIPPMYLRASMAQRMELFRGLMDTDGTCGRNGQMELGFSDIRLASDAFELASSLGIKAVLRPKSTACRVHYRFKFVAPFRCFNMPRKADRQLAAKCPELTRRRYITGVSQVSPRPMRCIRVDHSDGLYLVGRSFIATHNSGLLCGLALDAHHQSLLMRRNGVDLHGGGGLIEDLLRLNGSRDGFNGSSPPTLRSPDRIITFGSAGDIGDEQKYIGRARDLLGLDEATQFAENQVRSLMGWIRTVKPGQRTRAVFATNPPLSAVGEWVIGMFRPWLDLTHHNPAKPGELRWYITTRDGDFEVDGPETVQRDGEDLIPSSRTFIPAKLLDNPFIDTKTYQKQLDGLKDPYRSAARDGNFMAGRQDHDWQVIKTAWIREAQARWTPDPPPHAPMSCMGVDVAQGGPDQTVIACRYDGWFAPVEAFPGSMTPDGPSIAGLVFARRRNGAVVVIDMGGGYGGSAYDHLKAGGVDVVRHVGAEASVRRSEGAKLPFFNKRAEVYWRFSEALDPDQDGGSMIALPDDPELVADLTAPIYNTETGRLKVEAKVDIVARLGRSPDKGDAVVMAWSSGPKLQTHGNVWREFGSQARGTKPIKVNLGREAQRRR